MDQENDKLKKEFSELKKKFEALERDMSSMEKKIEEEPEGAQSPESVIEPAETQISEIFPQKNEDAVSIKSYTMEEINIRLQEKESKTAKSWKDIESSFGRFWLNKIGMIVFTLGIGFLISYTFKYFTPGLRVLGGYALSALFFGMGIVYAKKDQFRNFGLGLQAGGWAIAYFMTYAIYHFEASKIITSQFFDLCLLSMVAVGMILQALKYKSQGMVALGLIIAFVTSTLGGNFTESTQSISNHQKTIFV